MNSLILILFVGATVALAEIHVENDPGYKAPRPIVSLNTIGFFSQLLVAILAKTLVSKV